MTGAVSGLTDEIAAAVLTRLAGLAELAAVRPVDVERVRAEIGQLVTAWRHLLSQHHPADDSGRCPRCRSWWGWRRRWPCRVWRTAHTHLVVYREDTAPAAASWVPDASPARPLGVRVIPAQRSPVGPEPGGTPGVAALPPPVGLAAPGGTLRGGRHARREPAQGGRR